MSSIHVSQVVELLVIAINASLGFYILVRERPNKVSVAYFCMVMSLSFWVFASAFSDISTDLVSALLWARLAIVGPFLFPAFFVYFSYYFSGRNFSNKNKLVVVAIPLICLTTLNTSFNIAEVEKRSWGTDYVPGPLYLVLLIYLILYFTLAIRTLLLSSKNKPELKSQARLIYTGTVLFVVIGILTNLILPSFGYAEASSYGPSVGIFFAIFSMYAIIRHHLFDIQVIAAEVFTGTLSMLLLVYIFFASSGFDYVVRTLIFIFVVIFSYLTVRNMLREINDKERLANLSSDLEKANNKLQKLDKTKSEFLSIASHQLRTPISGIKGYLSMLLEGDFGKVEDKPKEIIKSIYDNTERLNGLVNDFLDVSRIERGKLVMERQMTDISEMVESIVSNFQPVAAGKKLKLEYTKPAIAIPKINVDPNKLRQVILNLVDNAIKYTQKGSVRVSLDGLNDRFRVCVRDTGVGLEPDEVKHLFKPFVRAQDASKSNATGSGLGLYVARKIVQYHGGKVWAESEGKSRGSTFCMEVPFEQSTLSDPDPEPYLE